MNIPSDLFFLFIIKMDDQMLRSVLDDDSTYMNLNATAFSDFMSEKIAHHKTLGDSTLLALPGTINGGKTLAYSFLGNKSKERLDMAVLVNDKKELLSVEAASDFVFDEFPFDIDSF